MIDHLLRCLYYVYYFWYYVYDLSLVWYYVVFDVFEGSKRSCSIGCRSFTASTRLSALRSLLDELIILTVCTLSSRAKDSMTCYHTGSLSCTYTFMTLFIPELTCMLLL